jgi:2'-hydroxyisoflavone reductase
LFNRGKTNSTLFPEIRKIVGDRDTADMEKICQEDWDVVVDFSAHYPQPLAKLLQKISGRVGRYILISTMSVYDEEALAEGEIITEESPTVECSKEEETDQTIYTYGKRKRACELRLLEHPEIHPIIFRPGLIYGPYDPTDRAYYWLWRCKENNPFLLAEADIRHQWTYAIDFARILTLAIFSPLPDQSIYLALTHKAVDFREIIATMGKICQTSPQYHLVDESWMDEHNIQFWQDLPLSLPYERLCDRSNLLNDFPMTFESFKKSWQHTKNYYQQLEWPEPRTGLSQEEEANLLNYF